MTEQPVGDGREDKPASAALGPVDLVFAVLALIAALPAALVRYPESADYLNHMAELFVLTAPADHPIHAFYTVHWHLLPNLRSSFSRCRWRRSCRSKR